MNQLRVTRISKDQTSSLPTVSSKLCTRVVIAVLGFALAGATSIRPAMAQSLEDSLDAELDGAGFSSAPADSKAKDKDKKGSTTSKPESGLKSDPMVEEELQMDLGDDDTGFSDELELDGGGSSAPAVVDKAPKSEQHQEIVLDEVPAEKAQPKASTQQAESPSQAPAVEEPQVSQEANPDSSDDLMIDDSADEPMIADDPSGGQAEPPLVEEEPPAIAEEPQPEPPAPMEEPAPRYQVSGSDEPNTEFEQRLHRIYKNVEPVSDERWEQLIGSRRSEVYSVQAGDTLWDISQTFFGDGFFWSKLWAQNGTIENPHNISVGKGVRFVAGNESQAPVIGVTDASFVTKEMIRLTSNSQLEPQKPVYREEIEKTITREELDSGTVIEESELLPTPLIPPPRTASKPPAKLPSSFRSMGLGGARTNNYDITGLDVEKSRSLTTIASITPNTLLFDAKPQSTGIIDEVETGERVASIGQNVFIKLNRTAQVGERFSVFFLRDSIRDSVRGRVGPLAEVGGVIEVVGHANDDKNVYRATVLTAINPIRQGSIVMEDPLPKASFKREGNRSDVQARVIGGEFEEQRRLLGESSVIFLDGGAGAGLKVGDLLGVSSRRGARRPSTKYPDLKKPIALIKVIDVKPSVATALVLEAQEEIVPGDLTSGEFPERHRDLRTDIKAMEQRAQAPAPQIDDGQELDFE